MKQIWRLGIATFMVAGSLFVSGFATAAEASPIDVVETTANKVIAQLQSNKATLRNNPTVVYRIIDETVLPHVDVNAMSRSVIKPAVWSSADASQRSRFTQEFTRLVVRTYAGGLAQYTSESVEFYPIPGGYEGKSRVQVKSKILRRGAPSISMNYRLIHRSGGWKVYDISVEGVSLLHSFRSQFAGQLSRGNFEELIQRLAQHNQEQS